MVYIKESRRYDFFVRKKGSVKQMQKYGEMATF